MSEEIDQGLIIENLNAYYKWHNLPLYMNETGICNGLAMVHAKYVLQEEEQKFKFLLRCIANNDFQGHEEEINHFAIEVLISFSPHTYDSKMNQHTGMNMLKVNNQFLTSSYNFSLATSDDNWAEIIKLISLQDREVARVTSCNHAVSIYKKAGKYHVYDPNYTDGFKTFANEKQLIRELHKNVFSYKSGDIGLQIQVIKHPEDKARELPSYKELYQKYWPKNINKPAFAHGDQFKTLVQAAQLQTEDEIRYLVEQGAKDIKEAALEAVTYNNLSAIKPLISAMNDKADISDLLHKALQLGRKEVFVQLMTEEKFTALFNEKASNFRWLAHAAIGSNPELLTLVLNKIKESILEQAKVDKDLNKPENQKAIAFLDKEIAQFIIHKSPKGVDALDQAVANGSKECVYILLKQLNAGGIQLDESDRLLYLLNAIRYNKRYAALCLMDEKPNGSIEESTQISAKLLQTISMSIGAVAQTELALLKDLEQRGMIFSPVARAIIAQKEHKRIGVFMFLGIQWFKFTDFCKEILCQRKLKGVSYDEEKFNKIKSQRSAILKDEDDLPPLEVLDPNGDLPIVESLDSFLNNSSSPS